MWDVIIASLLVCVFGGIGGVLLRDISKKNLEGKRWLLRQWLKSQNKNNKGKENNNDIGFLPPKCKNIFKGLGYLFLSLGGLICLAIGLAFLSNPRQNVCVSFFDLIAMHSSHVGQKNEIFLIIIKIFAWVGNIALVAIGTTILANVIGIGKDSKG